MSSNRQRLSRFYYLKCLLTDNDALDIEVLMEDKVSICKMYFSLRLYETRLSCPPRTIGSIVKITKKTNYMRSPLAFCEVEVFGTLPDMSMYHKNILLCVVIGLHGSVTPLDTLITCNFYGQLYCLKCQPWMVIGLHGSVTPLDTLITSNFYGQ